MGEKPMATKEKTSNTYKRISLQPKTRSTLKEINISFNTSRMKLIILYIRKNYGDSKEPNLISLKREIATPSISTLKPIRGKTLAK